MPIIHNGWIDNVNRVLGNNGGNYVRPVNKWLWHTTEGSSIAGAIGAYRANNTWPHLTWNPRTGELVQHLPLSMAARALRNNPGGVETNRHGVIQVEVVAFAREPFTGLPQSTIAIPSLPGLAVLRAAWRELGIPEVFPAGPPPAYPPKGVVVRSVDTWVNQAGHFGHCHVPENNHGDPGAIDVSVIFYDDSEVEMLSDQDKKWLTEILGRIDSETDPIANINIALGRVEGKLDKLAVAIGALIEAIDKK